MYNYNHILSNVNLLDLTKNGEAFFQLPYLIIEKFSSSIPFMLVILQNKSKMHLQTPPLTLGTDSYQ